MMTAAGLDVAQIYGATAIALQPLRPDHEVAHSFRTWQAVRVPSSGSFFWNSPWSGNDPPFEAIFLDSPGNGVSFEWQFARTIGEHEKTIIAGGLDATNVGEAIRIARPWGVDASSGLESAPGIKDHEKVRRFIAAARESQP